MTRISIHRPDDWHVHLRDGASLKAVAGFTAQRFGRAIVMPNLKPAITTTDMARAYRQRILAALPAGSRFEPLLTLYLTNTTAPAEIDGALASGFIHGVKLYPAGATTHSSNRFMEFSPTWKKWACACWFMASRLKAMSMCSIAKRTT
jgi:dihydroorotase